MENWTNLNKFLTIERAVLEQKNKWSKELIELSSKGEKEEIRALLKKGAAINCHEDFITPLIACIHNNHPLLAAYLLKVGASVSYKPQVPFDDALWIALKNKKHDFLRLFVANRCLLNKEDENNLTPLIYATQQSDLDSVEILLNHYRIKVNERDGSGNTALHYNVSKTEPTDEDIKIGPLLIAAGADINSRNLDGQTPEDMAKDFASKSMLMNASLEAELPLNETQQNQVSQPTTPKSKKMKI